MHAGGASGILRHPWLPGQGWAGSGTMGTVLSQLLQPLGSLPVLEDESSPAASVPLPLCSSSHSCVGSLSLEGIFVQVLPFPAVFCCLQGMQPGLVCSWQPRDPAESSVGNLLEVTSGRSGLDPILLFLGTPFSSLFL